MKKIAGLFVLAALVAYLTLWPVPIDPVAWDAPVSPGYAGPFARNDRLAAMERLDLDGLHGPEDIALDGMGRIYASTESGIIARFDTSGTSPEHWADTGGRPLGIEFAPDGSLIVADAYRGLLAIDTRGRVELLADAADGVPLGYADDVDVARDGRIYFSDASTRFRPADWSGTLAASVLDIAEHGGHGRLLVYDPATRQARTLLDGLQFANGVAVSLDQQFVLVNETGSYRVLRYWIAGPRAGESEPLIENLPSFPDNVSAGRDGRFWIGLVSPRSPVLDRFAAYPGVRRALFRLPNALRPGAQRYGHVIAIDHDGDVRHDFQDPRGDFPMITCVTESAGYLLFGSLTNEAVGRIRKSTLGLQSDH